MVNSMQPPAARSSSGEGTAALTAQDVLIPSELCPSVLLTGIKNSQAWPHRSLFVMIMKYPAIFSWRNRVFNSSLSFFMAMGRSHDVWIQPLREAFPELRAVWTWPSSSALSPHHASPWVLPATGWILQNPWTWDEERRAKAEKKAGKLRNGP